MNAISFFIKPNIVMLSRGDWLATTPVSSPLRIGVIGITEDDARRKFESSLECWKQIAEDNLMKADGINLR